MPSSQADGASVSSSGPTAAGKRDMAADKPGVIALETRDLGDLSVAMAGWLAERMPDARDVKVVDLSYPLGAGLSHETILFDAEWTEAGEGRRQGMVVRIKPTRQRVFLDDLFEEQYALMQLMHRTATVPVGAPLWLERDPALLGAPFFVMEKRYGRVAVSFPPYAQQGWLFDSKPADRRVMWEDAVRKLAMVQTVPVSEAQFLHFPGSFAEDFDEEVDRWVRYIDWVDKDGKQILLRRQFDRLMAKRPANRVEGIVWGDARLGNLMIGDDYKVTAVMDWEQPSLGGALHDLGWWLFFDNMHTAGRGLPRLEGMGTKQETIALWREVCGKPADDIEWYVAFASYKLECIVVRSAAMGTMPSGARTVEAGAGTAKLIDAL